MARTLATSLEWYADDDTQMWQGLATSLEWSKDDDTQMWQGLVTSLRWYKDDDTQTWQGLPRSYLGERTFWWPFATFRNFVLWKQGPNLSLSSRLQNLIVHIIRYCFELSAKKLKKKKKNAADKPERTWNNYLLVSLCKKIFLEFKGPLYPEYLRWQHIRYFPTHDPTRFRG